MCLKCHQNAVRKHNAIFVWTLPYKEGCTQITMFGQLSSKNRWFSVQAASLCRPWFSDSVWLFSHPDSTKNTRMNRALLLQKQMQCKSVSNPWTTNSWGWITGCTILFYWDSKSMLIFNTQNIQHCFNILLIFWVINVIF